MPIEPSVRLHAVGRERLLASAAGIQFASPHWRLIHVVAGRGSIQHAEINAPLRTPNCLLVPPHIPWRWLPAERPGVLEWMWVTWSMRPALELPAANVIRLGRLPQVEELHAFLRHWTAPDLRPRKLELLGWLERIFAFVTRSENRAQQRRHAAVERAKRMAQDHLDGLLPVAEVAERVGLSVDHFGVLFKEVSGVSFKTYHEGLRLERAKILLLHDGESARATAAQLGFSSAAYFSRRFAAHFGYPPSRCPDQR